VETMRELRTEFGVTNFYFHDDGFTLDSDWLESLCDRLTTVTPRFDWACGSRVECLDDRKLQMMRRAGCYQIGVGVESGSPAILRWLRKGVTPASLEEGVRRIHAAGIETKAYVIIGTPVETVSDVMRTAALIARLPIRHVQVAYFTPLPGAADYNRIPVPRNRWPQLNLLNPISSSSLPHWFLLFAELGIYTLNYSLSSWRRLRNIASHGGKGGIEHG